MATIREEVLAKAKEFYEKEYPKKEFVPGETSIPCSGKIFDEKEICAVVDAGLDFWLTAGRYAKMFEERFPGFSGKKYCSLANSGSSANLLAVSALTSPKLKERRLKPGDEVITIAASFPTTINPIIQNNLVPVFVDIDIGNYNVDEKKIAEAITDKTRAVVLAHTLGNPYNVDAILAIAREHNLFVIGDCCDALGSEYDGLPVGSFGDISTFSFYPAHHITMGEGGAVATDDPLLRTIINSFRDWGRDCWCDTGKDDTCGRRFSWQLGRLPHGYDHKYVYSHVGYNLKVTEMQAAIGVAQLEKLPGFIEARKRNFRQLYDGLEKYDRHIILPESREKAEPCWFGFPITIRDNTGFTRLQLVNFMESKKIATRTLFAGDTTKQPAYQDSRYRICGTLENTEKILQDMFWIGVYPGVTSVMINYVLEKFSEFFSTAVK